MPLLNKNRVTSKLKFASFFILYALQGVIAGFSLTALLNVLAAKGVSVGMLGKFTTLVGLPWVVQFFWGPLLDHFPNFAMGKRRFWIVTSLAASNAVLILLFFVPLKAENTLVFAAVFFVHSICASLLDAAADGMIIDQVPQTETGFVSALTQGGWVTGTAVSGLLFGWTLSHWTFRENVSVLLGLSLLVSLIPIFAREREEDAWLSLRLKPGALGNEHKNSRRKLKRFATVVGARLLTVRALIILVLSFATNLAFGVYGLAFNAELVQIGGWTDFELSRMQSIVGFVAGTAGSFLIGFLCDRLGYRKIFIGTLLTSSVVFLVYAVGNHSFTNSVPMTTTLLVFVTAMPTFVFVAMVPGVMQVARGVAAATLFTISMTWMNLGSIVGSVGADWLFHHFSKYEILGGEAFAFLFFAALTYGLGKEKVVSAAESMGTPAFSAVQPREKVIARAENPIIKGHEEPPRKFVAVT